MTGRVHDMILDPKLTGQLPEVIAEGSYYGMQTFDQHLLQHLHAGRVTMDAAMRVATSPHDFKLMVAAAAKPGQTARRRRSERDAGPSRRPAGATSRPPRSRPSRPSAPPAPRDRRSRRRPPPAPPPPAPAAPSAPPPGVTY